jgi:exo-poly-alpha-galacturonosidase
MGSHTGAWIQHILAEDNVIFQTDAGLRCKSTTYNGGGARDIVFRDSAMRDVVKQAFIFTLEYSDSNAALDYAPARLPGVFRDITVKNVSVERARGKHGSILVQGYPDKHAFHERIRFENVAFTDVPSASLTGLKRGVFQDVTFAALRGNVPWVVQGSEGLEFVGRTPRP